MALASQRMCRCVGVWLKVYAQDSLLDSVSHDGSDVDNILCLTGRAMITGLESSLVIGIVPDML